MYKNQFTDFGRLSNIDSIKRFQRISFFKKEIKQYPFSYFLLQSIYEAKEQYSKEEIKEIVSIFDRNVQASKLGEGIRRYLANRPNPDEANPNLLLANDQKQRQYIINPTAKLNMLVFWASWCGPCRREIPVLKQIYARYVGKGMSMASISIDENKEQWQKALKQEDMDWPQYLVDPAEIEKVKQQYNFAAIPLVVFTDGKGKEVKRFLGNEPGEEIQYSKVIEDILNKR